MSVARTLSLLAAALSCGAVIAPTAMADRHLDIVGGADAPAGAWPSIAYLRGGYHDRDGRGHDFACTGSVVAPHWIVTAAHCTFGDGVEAPERMVATLGITDSTDPAGERIAVDRFVPDPSYDAGRLVGDVGLLHLAQPTRRPPVPLATTTALTAGRYISPPGVPNAAGWGARDELGTQIPVRLQQAYLQVRTPAECGALVPGVDLDTQTCAGTPGAAVPCFGDSGGPLIEIDTATGQPALWGVTSYGPQVSAGLASCSVQLPAVYTWIPAQAGFIQATIAGSGSGVGSPPAPSPARPGDPGPGAPKAACRKARAAVTSARGRARKALRRLHAARRHGTRTTLAVRGYRRARARRRRAVATAARVCRA